MLPKPKALSVALTSRALRVSAHTLLTPPEHCEGRTSVLGSGVEPLTVFSPALARSARQVSP